ncbi:replication factor C subunit 2/4 [Angomonas deanei]|nr:replication factor C subunit 2/4 [Angomonas deanei]|eukprot:EPY33117.1 replication factor C subunit 2/4 [Angomonas deanei]
MGRSIRVPAFKLIILDEADALLPDTQGALRRMMEDFSDVTRFCILCNYVSRIIDPIASRCAKFRFRPLMKETLHSRIEFICKAENIKMSSESLKALEAVSGGDLRVAIMNVQSAQKAHGNDLTKEDFVSVTGSLSESLTQDYVAALLSKDMSTIVAKTRSIVDEGFPAAKVVSQLQKYMLSSACTMNAVQRGKILLKLCDSEKRIADGGDDFLQLLDIGAAIAAA